MRLLLLLFLLLSLALSAQPAKPGIREVTFVTEPPKAEVTDSYGHPLGLAGTPIPLDLDKYGADTSVEITFSLPNYAKVKKRIATADLKGRYPASGAVELPPSQSSNALVFGLGGGLGLAVGVLFWRRRGGVARPALTQPGYDTMVSRQLGPYRLTQRLGQGGMATVYKAVPLANPDPEAAVAIKILRKELFQEDNLARFRQEARVTSQLNHPNILRLIDWGEEPDCAYLVLELIEGGTLRDRMNGQPIACDEVWDALSPVCSALACAHQRGIIHRDLKPENLMITKTGTLKITDFGLAFTMNQERLTATGTTLGTPAYMAPEQIQGAQPHPSMDQYSLGAVAYELLTGRVPFLAGDMMQLIYQVLSEPASPPSQWTEVPPGTDEVLLKMLAKNPADRYASVEEAAAQLHKVLGG